MQLTTKKQHTQITKATAKYLFFFVFVYSVWRENISLSHNLNT